ncbi:hypothetical protein ACFXPQ_27245 [Streptomyces lydicus]|uniref:hypothetical protein n=1 Tax=Streptomyces lydicus TaxID=47763 RepID=UPI0036D08A91
MDVTAPRPLIKTPERTPLSSAAFGGHLGAVRLLLNNGARPDRATFEAAARGMKRTEQHDSAQRRGNHPEYRAVQTSLERALQS